MNTDWVAHLAPERAPPPPPWWPPASGWWYLLAALLLLAAALVGWRLAWNRPRRRAQRAALAELQRIRALGEASQPGALQRLLRRYALTVYGTQIVAPLSGEAWLQFLEARGGAAFGGGSGRKFLAAAYGRESVQPEWLAGAEAFIKHAARAAEAA